MQTYPQLYAGAYNCGVLTWKRQGIRGLYAGTVPSLTANILENASLFMFYGFCQKVVQVISVHDLSTLSSQKFHGKKEVCR